MKILVVDDDQVSSMVLSENLGDLGYEVNLAADGEEAWSVLQREHFPIVILDWMMPRMDGIEVCRRLRSAKSEMYTYVVLLTGRGERDDKLAALEAGADDFLIKPVDHAELVARLRVGGRIIQSEVALREANAGLREAREKEAMFGGEIQRRLLVGKPPIAIPGVDIALLSAPSQAIDGDFSDFFTYENGVVDLVVGDVMGKGVPAALVGAGVKTSLQKTLIEILSTTRGLPSLRQIVTRLTGSVAAELIDLGTFLTLAYTRIDGHSQECSYVNCGHPKMIAWRAKEAVCEFLDTTAVPIGFATDAQISESRHQAGAGDLILLYSDGVTDLIGSDGARLGELGVMSWVNDHAGMPIRELLQGFVRLRSERGAVGKVDDFTVVAIRFTGSTAERNGVRWFWSEAAVGSIRSAVREAAVNLSNLAPEQVTDLIIAVQEVVSNAVRHARPSSRGLPVGLTVGEFDSGVKVELRYPGVQFNPAGSSAELEVGEKEGGLGLPLIRRAVDSVEYAREGDMNAVTLFKRGDIR